MKNTISFRFRFNRKKAMWTLMSSATVCMCTLHPSTTPAHKDTPRQTKETQPGNKAG